MTKLQLQNLTEADTDRAGIVLYENDSNGQKGYYKKDEGPSASFRACGGTWRDVAIALGYIANPTE